MYIVVFITASGVKEARRISSALLKKKLVACVNIVEKVESFFWWEGNIDKAKELLLIAKSKKSRLPGIIKLVKSEHSYSCPEVIALPVMGGNKDYLRWIDGSVGKLA